MPWGYLSVHVGVLAELLHEEQNVDHLRRELSRLLIPFFIIVVFIRALFLIDTARCNDWGYLGRVGAGWIWGSVGMGGWRVYFVNILFMSARMYCDMYARNFWMLDEWNCLSSVSTATTNGVPSSGSFPLPVATSVPEPTLNVTEHSQGLRKTY